MPSNEMALSWWHVAVRTYTYTHKRATFSQCFRSACRSQITHTGVQRCLPACAPFASPTQGRAGSWLSSEGRALGWPLAFAGGSGHNTNTFLSFESLSLLLGPQPTFFQQEMKCPLWDHDTGFGKDYDWTLNWKSDFQHGSYPSASWVTPNETVPEGFLWRLEEMAYETSQTDGGTSKTKVNSFPPSLRRQSCSYCCLIFIYLFPTLQCISRATQPFFSLPFA